MIYIFFSEMEITNAQKLGVGFGSFGVFFIFLGVLLLFDKGMFALIMLLLILSKPSNKNYINQS